MHLIPTNAPHFHMLVSVFPSVGLLFALGLFIASMVTNNTLMQRLCLFAFAGLAVLGIPTYLSGDMIQKTLEGRQKISMDAAEWHLVWAWISLFSLAITGLLALNALVKSRKQHPGPSRNDLHLVLGFGLLTLIGMAVVGEIGWEIAHYELVLPRAEDGTPQNWSHVHIILNHLPTVGFVFALFFFFAGLVRDNDGMKRAGLIIFTMCAVLAASTYVTGTAAMWALTDPPVLGISQVRINQHRDFAIYSLLLLAFTGGWSWFELWRYRFLGRFSKISIYAIGALAIVTFLVLAETGHLGGQINHPEIREAGEVLPTDPSKFLGPQVEMLINTITWFVPWQTVHFFGYTLVFATVLVVCLRIWGVWKGMSFSAVHRLLPLGAFGVLMNIFSGMLMMMADAHRYLNNFSFWPKMLFLPIGAIAVIYFSVSDRLWATRANEEAPMVAKWVAALVLFSWFMVIAGGRLLPYLLP
jgi:uncharacterized membrane protein